MSQPSDSDTIAALATPAGRGGLAVVRLSGAGAGAIATALAGRLPAPRRAALRVLRDADGGPLDQGIVLWFPAPGSFTGEDVVELQIHGSPVLAAALLQRCRALGAREAGPGEFSRRAFLNGRIDLAQAEAIADLIDSASGAAARAAMRSLKGEFSAAIAGLAEGLVDLRARIEAAIDFPEEEVDLLAEPELAARLRALLPALDAIRQSAAQGRRLRDGMTIVIAGAPNAGKSSLLNRLAGYEAAIVTEVPGTTRDLLSEDILVHGMPLTVVDTAGLRHRAGRVEAEGIRRAREAMARADRVLLLEDATRRAPAGDDALPAGVPVTIVRNKIDLTGEAPGREADGAGLTRIRLSALTGAGIDALRAHLADAAGLSGEGGGAFSARQRHLDALDRSHRHVVEALRQLEEFRAGELAAEELRLAHDALGEITGEFTSEDLLGRIFATFCIGK